MPEDQPAHLSEALKSYLGARLELLGIEAQEAAIWAQERGKSFAIGACLLLFGYLCVLASLVGIIGSFIPKLELPEGSIPGWAFVALALGILHLIIALVALRRKPSYSADELFSASKAELKADKQWLSRKKS